jgi:hypothetical protein
MKSLFSYLLIAGLGISLSAFGADEKPAKKMRKPTAEEVAQDDGLKKGAGKQPGARVKGGKAGAMKVVGTLFTKSARNGDPIFVLKTEDGLVVNVDFSARLETAIERKGNGAAAAAGKGKGKDQAGKEKDNDKGKDKVKKAKKAKKAEVTPADDLPDF